MANPDNVPLPSDDASRDPRSPYLTVEVALRSLAQVIGLVLIVIGGYYLLAILGDVVAVVRQPAQIQASLDEFVDVIHGDKLVVPIGEQELPVGRPLALGAMILWYLMWVWIAGKMVSLGGQLTLAVIHERKEFAAALKEFLSARRQKGP